MNSRLFDEVVAGLYRAASGRGKFSEVLHRISESMGLIGCQMVGVDSSNGALTFSHGASRIPTEAEIEYIRTYHKVDPRIPMILAREPGQWLYCEDEFSDEESLAQPYYRDLLIPYGGRHSASTKLFQGEREVVLIAFLSPLGAPGFGKEAREILERIGHHLREAVQIYVHVRALATGHAVGLELIERLGKPAWVIDDALQVLGANSLASASVANPGSGLRLANGRLLPTSVEGSNDLAATVRQLIVRSERAEPNPRACLRLRGGQDVVSVSLFEPRETMQAFGPLRRFLVMLHQPGPVPEPDLYLWQAAFDLTPAEVRVCRMIYGGATLKEAAQALGVSSNTVNSQLDSAYAKLGVGSKVELVQRLRSLD
jgi:DNA-binding CsgD family transcriptional regulator